MSNPITAFIVGRVWVFLPAALLIGAVAGFVCGWTVQGWRWDASKLDLEQAARAAEQQTRAIEDDLNARIGALTYAWYQNQADIETSQQQQADARAQYRHSGVGACRLDGQFRLLHNRAAVPAPDTDTPGGASAAARTSGGFGR